VKANGFFLGWFAHHIQIHESSNPIVNLEQYGIEVGRMVGKEPVNSASSHTLVEPC
jgi:hypothetical protein